MQRKRPRKKPGVQRGSPRVGDLSQERRLVVAPTSSFATGCLAHSTPSQHRKDLYPCCLTHGLASQTYIPPLSFPPSFPPTSPGCYPPPCSHRSHPRRSHPRSRCQSPC